MSFACADHDHCMVVFADTFDSGKSVKCLAFKNRFALVTKTLIVGTLEHFLATQFDHLSFGDAQQESCCQNAAWCVNALSSKITNIRPNENHLFGFKINQCNGVSTPTTETIG